jgi:GTP cyclohydrolase I
MPKQAKPEKPHGVLPISERDSNLLAPDRDGKVERQIAQHVAAILDLLGLNRSDPNLRSTPERVARLFLEMFHGLQEGAAPTVTTFPNTENYQAMVMERDIPFYSMCAHHLVPFYGHAHIAYIPARTIVGLSKLPQVLEFYAHRPQLQERLTEQVADFLATRLEPLGVMVVIEARHLCMEMRGVRKHGTLTVTSAIRGCFRDRRVREEFLAILARPREGRP